MNAEFATYSNIDWESMYICILAITFFDIEPCLECGITGVWSV